MGIFDLFKTKNVIPTEPAPSLIQDIDSKIQNESSLNTGQCEELALLSQFLVPQDMRNWSEEIFGKYINNGLLVDAKSEQKIQALSLSEIKAILKENGQKTTGNKDELFKRILTNLPDKIEHIAFKLPTLFICNKELEEQIYRYKAKVKCREGEIRDLVFQELIENRINEALNHYEKFQMELPELWRKEPGEVDIVKEILNISFVPGMSTEELKITRASAAAEVFFGRSVKGAKIFMEKWRFLEKLKGYGISEDEYLKEKLKIAKKLKIEEESVSYHDVILSIMNKQVLSIKDPYHLGLKYNQMAGALEDEGRESFHIRKLSMEFHLKSLLESDSYKTGLIKEVDIWTFPDCCPSCKKLEGNKYSIKKALSVMPLPNEDCTNINKSGIKVCRCSYYKYIDTD